MDGRGGSTEVESQNTGQAVWEEKIKTSDDFIKTRKWGSNTSILLDSHIDGHQNYFVNLTKASTHVAYHLPNTRTRVSQFLHLITCQDPDLLAYIAAVKKDDPGMRDDFEEMFAYIAPFDEIACKRARSKRPSAKISAAAADGSNLNYSKFGKTGVELCWYKYHEYKALNDNQKVDLKAWKATQPAHARNNRSCPKKSNQCGHNQGERQVKGALTPGSHNFKKVVRSQVAALEVASKAK